MKRILLLICLLLPRPVLSAELKIATWNLNWLTTRSAGDPDLPSDVTPRSDEDFARLAQYAKDLNADVVAIEEVDGFSAASKVFPRDQYSIHMTRDHVVQRVGIVVRRGLRYDINPDITVLVSASSAQRRRHHAAPRCLRPAHPGGSPEEGVPRDAVAESQRPCLRGAPWPRSHH